MEKHLRDYVPPTMTTLFVRRTTRKYTRFPRLFPASARFSYEYRPPDDENPSGLITAHVSRIPLADYCQPSSSGKTIVIARDSAWLRCMSVNDSLPPRININIFHLGKHFKSDGVVRTKHNIPVFEHPSDLIRGNMNETLTEATLYIRVSPRDSSGGLRTIYASSGGPALIQSASPIPIYAGFLAMGKREL
jgi:hypothetical protein